MIQVIISDINLHQQVVRIWGASMDRFTKVRSHAGMRGASYYVITHKQNTRNSDAGFLRVGNGGADAA
jgi:hypothetical protein